MLLCLVSYFLQEVLRVHRDLMQWVFGSSKGLLGLMVYIIEW